MANPKPPSLQDRLQALQADEPAPETEMAPKSTDSSDPVENLVNFGASRLPEGTPDWLRTVGRWTIPQNTPEAVTAAALLPFGGPAGGLAAKTGIKALAGLGARSIPAFLGRTALRAGAVGAAGAATGHDPTESAMMGAGGSVVGEGTGAALKAVVQNKVVNRMYGEVTGKLANTFRSLIGPWLPEGEIADQAVIRDVLADGPSKRVGAEINTLRKKNAATPVNIMDLEPELQAHGVVHAWTPGETAGAGRVDPKTVKGGMVWPAVRDFEKSVGPGEAMTRYGQVARVEQGVVPFGSIDAQIEAQMASLDRAIKSSTEPNVVLQLATRLDGLEKARLNIASRLKDPDMALALKEYGKVKQLRDLLWGSERAAHNRGETVVDDLLDNRTGNLSKKGIGILAGRVIADSPRLGAFRPDEVTAIQQALNVDLALGGARAEAGRGLKALLPTGFSWFGGIPHPHWGGKGPGSSFMPGWEGERSALQKVYPDALRILLGTEVPAKGKEILE